jgi:subtilisin family serine protease
MYQQPGLTTDYDPTAHGTTMICKIMGVTNPEVGPNLGVSRGASVIVVKLPQILPLQGPDDRVQFRQSTVQHAWNMIADDIFANSYFNGRAVISVSQSSIGPQAYSPEVILNPNQGSQANPGANLMWTQYNIIRRLMSVGVLIVHAAGNGGVPVPPTAATWDIVDPLALWGSQYNFPIITVGATDNSGTAWIGTQSNPPARQVHSKTLILPSGHPGLIF